MADTIRAITLRLPADLLERVRQVAQEERRSLNQQVVVLLEQALLERQQQRADAREGRS